jgi:hypothetical protein
MIALEQRDLKAQPLHFSLVSQWLVMGFSLAATMLALVGWQMVTEIWFGSGVGLALLLFPGAMRARRQPITLPEYKSEAAD